MIVKNEEANLPACLESVRDLVDEMIIVDTGSTDRTAEVARGLGAKVFPFPWIDSFAAARNESLRHARGEWIFWMDADDRLDETNRQKLRSLLADLPEENTGFVMKCLCLPDPNTGTATVVDHIRLFRSHPELRWKYRVHEQILGSLRRIGAQVRWSDVVIQHVGYQDSSLRRRKLQRDLNLLTLENSEQPEDPFTLFNLGSVYQEQGRFADALTALRRSLELSHPSDSIVRKMYALIAQCHRQLKQSAEALEACRQGQQVYPEDIELLYLEGMIRKELSDRAGAIACLRQLLNSTGGDHFASIDAGLQSYKTHHNLAVLYKEEGERNEAERHWQLALESNPDFLPAWLGLAENYLSTQSWQGLAKVIQSLDRLAPLEAAVLRAREYLARKDFAAARAILEPTIAQHPHMVYPLVIYSHVLLQEGSDLAAAEKILRDILAIAPNHEESRHNLTLLLQQRAQL